MKPKSIEFIFKAMNELASGKYDPETEQCLADAIEDELITMHGKALLGEQYQATGDATELRFATC